MKFTSRATRRRLRKISSNNPNRHICYGFNELRRFLHDFTCALRTTPAMLWLKGLTIIHLGFSTCALKNGTAVGAQCKHQKNPTHPYCLDYGPFTSEKSESWTPNVHTWVTLCRKQGRNPFSVVELQVNRLTFSFTFECNFETTSIPHDWQRSIGNSSRAWTEWLLSAQQRHIPLFLAQWHLLSSNYCNAGYWQRTHQSIRMG